MISLVILPVLFQQAFYSSQLSTLISISMSTVVCCHSCVITNYFVFIAGEMLALKQVTADISKSEFDQTIHKLSSL